MFSGGTSISGAIDYAMRLFPGSGFKGFKRVIDVSGDGSNNRGRDVTDARDEAVAAGVVDQWPADPRARTLISTATTTIK